MTLSEQRFMYIIKDKLRHATSVIMANANVQVDFIDNNKGGQILVHNDFQFSVKNRHKDTTYWRCRHQTRGCFATATTQNNVLCKIGLPHNHASDPKSVEIAKLLNKMKKRTREEVTPVPTIYEEELSGKYLIILKL